MLDIGSEEAWPSCALSNFAAHQFMLDGVACASMEGFLQSLKFEDQTRQIEVCRLVGKEAKRAGRDQPWYETQQLFWCGLAIDRHSKEYEQLLFRAYDALLENGTFQMALLATGNQELGHTIGKEDAARTVLTRDEFVNQLTRLRSKLQEQIGESIRPCANPASM